MFTKLSKEIAAARTAAATKTLKETDDLAFDIFEMDDEDDDVKDLENYDFGSPKKAQFFRKELAFLYFLNHPTGNHYLDDFGAIEARSQDVALATITLSESEIHSKCREFLDRDRKIQEDDEESEIEMLSQVYSQKEAREIAKSSLKNESVQFDELDYDIDYI